MKISKDTIKVFGLKDEGVVFYLDEMSKLYWSKDNAELMQLDNLPWEYQLPFYLKFLHDDALAERFKKMKILGAIDVFIKSQYFFKSKDNLTIHV